MQVCPRNGTPKKRIGTHGSVFISGCSLRKRYSVARPTPSNLAAFDLLPPVFSRTDLTDTTSSFFKGPGLATRHSTLPSSRGTLYTNLVRVFLAATYVANENLDDARWQVEEILALNPDFTLSYVEDAAPIRDPNYKDRFLRDLQRAGLSH